MTVISAILTFLGIPVLTNGIISSVNQASHIGTYLTIGLGVLLVVMGVFFRLIKKLFIYPLFKVLSWIVTLGLAAAMAVSGFLYIYGTADTTNYNEDYLIILGCGVNGTEPSESLRMRLDKALKYTDRNPDCTVIVTGGQGDGEDITEAEAMQIYLTDNGIPPERILMEDKSTSTSENFIYANKLVNGELACKTVVFITNDFHIYRAISLAKLNGFDFNHLCADTPTSAIIPSYLRETLALVQMYILKK